MLIESVMLSNHFILCHPLLLLPSIFPSNRVFSNDLALHIRWWKYWNFSINPSNKYSGLISFRSDGFDLFAAQGALKSLLQHHSSKASNLWHSAFFVGQFSHPYVTTGKTMALTIQSFVGNIKSLLFNTLSRFFIAFLSRSKHLLILWLQSPSAVLFASFWSFIKGRALGRPDSNDHMIFSYSYFSKKKKKQDISWSIGVTIALLKQPYLSFLKL